MENPASTPQAARRPQPTHGLPPTNQYLSHEIHLSELSRMCQKWQKIRAYGVFGYRYRRCHHAVDDPRLIEFVRIIKRYGAGVSFAWFRAPQGVISSISAVWGELKIEKIGPCLRRLRIEEDGPKVQTDVSLTSSSSLAFDRRLICWYRWSIGEAMANAG